MMGSPTTESGRDDDETLHSVTLTKPFYCGKYEVTAGQWWIVMGNKPTDSDEVNPSAPVDAVSWDTCQMFLKKLCQLEGVPEGTYRLLTEAEWEYACRAGTDTALYNGDLTVTSGQCRNLDQVGWYAANSKNMTHAVGQKKPNAFGLYDMHGNAWEWCQDSYLMYPSSSVIDPTGEVSGITPYHVLRGGGSCVEASLCRSSNRIKIESHEAFWPLGLRLAATAPSLP